MAPELPFTQVSAYARRVEKLGFDGLHIAETTHDSLAVALLAAEHTERIVIRTAVTLAFVRSPMLTAYAAWDLQTFSGGRFELGLGSQIRQNIEDRFGMPWSEPCARMAEYVNALTAIFAAFRSGGSVHHEGDAYRITRLQPYFNPGPNDIEPPHIWLGAVNARMCELAGGVADGVVTHSTNSDPVYLRDVVRPALQRGAQAAGRSGLPQLVASTAVATGSTDQLVRQERERQRRMLAFLLSTPAYSATLKRHGWNDLADGLRALIKQQRWDDLPTVLDDTVLDQLVTAGRYDQLADLLRAKYDGIVDGVVLPPVSADEGEDQPVQACIRNLQG